MSFKLQTKDYSFGKRWQDCRYVPGQPGGRNSFVTADAAWAASAAYDEDGIIDRRRFRVITE